jgi:nucleotide-binding universal stress UspA family protein
MEGSDRRPSLECKVMLPIHRILVPIDWAELSNRAFQLADSLARDHNAELVVLNVVPLAAEMYGPPSECYLDHLLVELRRLKPSDPTTRVRYQLAEGDPATEILRVATEAQCDLIVMGTHGRTGLNRFVMGSVAEAVLRLARCLVLTVTCNVPANWTGESQGCKASESLDAMSP